MTKQHNSKQRKKRICDDTNLNYWPYHSVSELLERYPNVVVMKTSGKSGEHVMNHGTHSSDARHSLLSVAALVLGAHLLPPHIDHAIMSTSLQVYESDAESGKK